MRYAIAAAVSVILIGVMFALIYGLHIFMKRYAGYGVKVSERALLFIQIISLLRRFWYVFAALILGVTFGIAALCGKRG
jgi:hypothetical protein